MTSDDSKDDVSGSSNTADTDDLPTEEELRSIISDAGAALLQMQSTVNEVLDFRAIDSGMSSLKLNKQAVIVADVSTAVRCCTVFCVHVFTFAMLPEGLTVNACWHGVSVFVIVRQSASFAVDGR